jgi:putative two-component system response regulator
MTTANTALLTHSLGVMDVYACPDLLDVYPPPTTAVEHAYAEMLERLLRASAYKDAETGAHLARTRWYTSTVAGWLAVPPADARLMAAAAPLHDVGKIGIPDAVLHKHGPLTPAEWQCMQQHPQIGAQLLEGSASPLVQMARDIALTHHERWDGSGYPQGLRGEAIPLAGRIVMLGDQYDALRSVRPYKPALDHATTCAILLQGDGRTRPSHFDPRLLDAFRVLHREFAAIYAWLRDEGVEGVVDTVER